MERIYDVYEDRCPTRMVLDRIADKWALLILDRLRVEAVRFNLLRREIKGISQSPVADAEEARARRADFEAGVPDRAGDGRIFADAAGADADRHGGGACPLGGGQYRGGDGGAEGL